MNALDEMMGFDPANMTIFNETTSSNVDPRIYKSQPRLSKSEDGSYRSKIRILFNPHSIKESVVHFESFYLKDSVGGFIVPSSLSNGDKSCPVFKGFKKVRYAGEEGTVEREEALKRAKSIFTKNSSNWVLIQIIEDDNQPELVGQFKFWKIPVGIFDKLNAKMKPVDQKKMPDIVMDYLLGKVLELEVTPGPNDPENPSRKFTETKYNLSEFDTEVTPIMNVDGTQFFSEDEISLIESYADAKKKIAKKTEKEKDVAVMIAKRSEEISKLNASEIGSSIRTLYNKALEFMIATAPNVCDMGYKPWDEELTKRVTDFLIQVDAGNDPGVKVDAPVSAAADSLPDMFGDMVSGGATTVEDADSDETDDLPF